MLLKRNLVLHFIGLFGYSLNAISVNPPQGEIDNYVAFCKVYGYVRYFHPTDEASEIDWNKFAVWGIKKVKNLSEKDKLLNCFNSTFEPIAPTVEFSTTSYPENYKPSYDAPKNNRNLKTTCWQHFGVQGIDSNSPYKSVRTNRISESTLFSETVKIHDCITDKLSENLYCMVPLCLYISDSATFPKSDPTMLNRLKDDLKRINPNDTTLENKIASVVITWNLVQHFYPYREKMDNWEQSLKDAIVKCYTDSTPADFIGTLNILLSHINDGHAFASSKALSPIFLPAMDWKYIHDTLVISEIFDTKTITDLQVGDVVLDVDGVSAGAKIKEAMKAKSASTLRYKTFLAVFSLLKGEQNSVIRLRIFRKGEVKQIEVKRVISMPFYWQHYMSPMQKYKEINDSTIYINFSKASITFIDSLSPVIGKKKFVICDLRGYPNGNHRFLSHFLTSDDTAKSWFQIPQIIFPNYESVRYSLSGWNLKKTAPWTSKLIFIIDQEVVSYGESFMSIVENYKLGIIVGDSTAGTNGNMNAFNLPFNATVIKFTGMNATKLNGSKLVGVGIVPNVTIKATIEGINGHKDEMLDKAIEISSHYEKYKGY